MCSKPFISRVVQSMELSFFRKKMNDLHLVNQQMSGTNELIPATFPCIRLQVRPWTPNGPRATLWSRRMQRPGNSDDLLLCIHQN